MRARLWLPIAAMIAGCATPPATDRAGMQPYAFVVLGEEGRAVARVIAAAAACPELEFDGVGVTMDVRARPATIPLRPTRSAVWVVFFTPPSESSSSATTSTVTREPLAYASSDRARAPSFSSNAGSGVPAASTSSRRLMRET